MSRRVGHADHAPPVVHDESEVAIEPEVVEQELEVVDPAGQRVSVSRIVGLVRHAAADMVGNDHPVRAAQRVDQVPVVE